MPLCKPVHSGFKAVQQNTVLVMDSGGYLGPDQVSHGFAVTLRASVETTAQTSNIAMSSLPRSIWPARRDCK
jgi:hypothetical protein